VANLEKLLAAARNNPRGLSFADFEALLRAAGWVFRRQSGSHRLWYSPKGFRLPIQKEGNKAKAYQVRQFLARLEAES
jgi:predicted RNA binding protein YcfA (HicA-like mRNA interferase family)